MQEQMDTALLFIPSLPPQNSLWPLYGQFVYDLGVAYLMTDEVLDNSDWAKTTTPTSHIDVKTRLHHGTEQVFLELRRQRWIPLALSQATGELWTSIANVVRATNQVLVEFVASEDRIATQYYHRDQDLRVHCRSALFRCGPRRVRVAIHADRHLWRRG